MKLEYKVKKTKTCTNFVQYDLRKDGEFKGLITLEPPYNDKRIKLVTITMEE